MICKRCKAAIVNKEEDDKEVKVHVFPFNTKDVKQGYNDIAMNINSTLDKYDDFLITVEMLVVILPKDMKESNHLKILPEKEWQKAVGTSGTKMIEGKILMCPKCGYDNGEVLNGPSETLEQKHYRPSLFNFWRWTRKPIRDKDFNEMLKRQVADGMKESSGCSIEIELHIHIKGRMDSVKNVEIVPKSKWNEMTKSDQ